MQFYHCTCDTLLLSQLSRLFHKSMCDQHGILWRWLISVLGMVFVFFCQCLCKLSAVSFVFLQKWHVNNFLDPWMILGQKDSTTSFSSLFSFQLLFLSQQLFSHAFQSWYHICPTFKSCHKYIIALWQTCKKVYNFIFICDSLCYDSQFIEYFCYPFDILSHWPIVSQLHREQFLS